jgi:hypothetical protein
MSRGDQAIEGAANGLRRLSEQAAARGGVGAKLADVLADDAEFVRQLKPSLIRARARGEAPTDRKPGETPVAPAGPQIGRRPKPPGSGRNPWAVVGAALAIGIVLAKIIDWRSHAHPRD